MKRDIRIRIRIRNSNRWIVVLEHHYRFRIPNRKDLIYFRTIVRNSMDSVEVHMDHSSQRKGK